MIKVFHIIHRITDTTAATFQVLGDGVKLNAMVTEQTLILLDTVDEVFLLQPLLPAPRRLRGNNTTLNAGFYAISARFVLITSDFTLLTKYTTCSSGQLLRSAVGGLTSQRPLWPAGFR